MMRQSVRAMVIFTATVDKGSMIRAAKSLNMSPSAISQQIQKLEEQLGLALLHRNTRAFTLTEAGQLFYQRCKQMIELAEDTDNLLNGFKNVPSGNLKISAPSGFCGSMLSKPLKLLVECHSEIRLNLQLQDAKVDLIREGIDIAIQMGPLSDSGFYAHNLAEWNKILCVSPMYIAGKFSQLPAQPRQLQEWDRIAHHGTPTAYNTITRIGSGESYELPAGRIEVNNMQALVQFTLDGLGYAALPEPDVRLFLQQGRLLQVLPDWTLPRCTAYAVTQDKETAVPKVRESLTILKECFKRYSTPAAAA